ncbi:tetratricopeptide repeat protein [Candidatus Desantisbacteria bacterium]|nr:tetratricopeptide repeat protein [Candidatus Desantisbacteria bacterium]
MCDKIIRFFLLCVILCIPVWFDLRLYATFDLAKLTLLYLLVIPMLGVWAIKWLSTKECRFVRTPLDIPIFAFWGINIACTIISWSPCISLFGFYKRYEGLFAITGYICLYYVVVNFADKVFVKKMIKTAILVAAFESIYGIFQHFGHDPFSWSFFDPYRVFATFGSAPFLSTYLIMVFFFALAMYLKKEEALAKPHPSIKSNKGSALRKQGKKQGKGAASLTPEEGFSTAFARIYPQVLQTIRPWYYAIAVILIVIGFFYTSTRATTLGISFGLVLFGIMADRQRLVEEKGRLRILLACLIPFIAYFMLNPNTSVIGRFLLVIDEPQTQVETSIPGITNSPKIDINKAGSGRIGLWRSTIGVIKEHPILGIGLDTLQLANIGTDKAHNDFLDVAVTRGLIGLGIYLWFLFTLAVVFLKTCRRLTGDNRILFVCLGACELGYLVQNQFNFGLICIMSLFWSSLGMMMVIGGLTIRPETSLDDTPRISFALVRWLLYSVSFIGIIVVMFLATIPYQADIWYRKGFEFVEKQRYTEAIPYLEKAVEIFPYETCYWKVLNSIYVERANNDVPNRQVWIKKVLNGSHLLLRFIHKDEGSYFNLGMIYSLIGEEKKAEEAYKKTITLSKGYLNAYNNLGTLYANQKRWDEAIEMFEKTLECDRNHPSALANLKRVYTIKGEQEKAFDADEKYGKGIERHLKLAESYYKKGMMSETINEFQEILKKDPKNIDIHKNLGSIYYQKGMKKEARTEFESVLKLKPDDEYTKGLLKMTSS